MKLSKYTKNPTTARAFALGKLLEKNKGKHYKLFAIMRSTAYLYTSLYRKFVLELKQHPKHLSTFKLNRLQIIQSVVHKDVPDWLNKARELSLSDLRKEVWKTQGKPTLPPTVINQEKVGRVMTPGFPPTYVAYVKLHPCLIHLDRKSEMPHMDMEYWKRIPLCEECHTDYRINSKEFLWLNRVKIFDFFYTLILTMEQDIGELQEINKKLRRKK